MEIQYKENTNLNLKLLSKKDEIDEKFKIYKFLLYKSS